MLLYDLLEEARTEQGYPEQATDWNKILRPYDHDFDKFISSTEDGFIAGNFTRSYYLMYQKPIVLEIAWYVRPDKRNTGIGMELYSKLEGWARKRGAEYILQGRSTSKDCSSVGPFYLRKID